MLFIILFGSIVSLFGTMIGASLGVIVKKPSKKLLGGIIGFAGGLMLSVVVFDLIPEAIEKWNFAGTIIFSVLGMLSVMLIDNLLSIDKVFDNSHVKVAFLTALGIMMHNFPEGIIMGCGFVGGSMLGLKMSLIIAIHDIPEGIAISAPLMASRVKSGRILWYAFLTALPTALGVGVGALIGSISEAVLGGSLAVASGIMLYVVCGELLPEASKLWDGLSSTVGILTGIIGGLIVTTLI